MAIARDVDTTATFTTTATFNHAGNASARAAVVLIHQSGSTDEISGVTYGGVAMTELGTNSETTEAGRVYIYWLDGIAGGTQQVIITSTGSTAKRYVVSTMTVASGKGVAVAGAGYATGTSTSVANPTWNITGLTASEAVLAYEVIHSGLQTMTTTPQASPAWTLINSNDLGSIGNGFAYISNTPGGTTLACGWAAATADDFVGASVAFKEITLPTAVGDTAQLVWKTAAPVGDTSQVVADVAEPVGDTSQVVADVAEPVGDTSQVVAKVAEPIGDTSQIVAKVLAYGGGLVNKWLASDIAQSDGTTVASWTDSIGSIALTQGTETKKPTYKTNVLNGHPAVLFDRSQFDTLMSATGRSILQSPTGVTVIVVLKTDAGPAGGNYWGNYFLLWTTQGDLSLAIDQNAHLEGYSRGSTYAPSTAPVIAANTPYVLAFTNSGGTNNAHWYYDATAANPANGTVPLPDSNTKKVVLGSWNNAGDWFGGHIAEIRVYNVVLDATQIATVTDELNTYYGLGGSGTTTVSKDSQVVYNVAAPAGDTSQVVAKVAAPAGDISQVVARVATSIGDASQVVAKVAVIAGDTSQVIAKVVGLGSDTSQIVFKVVGLGSDTSQIIAKVRAPAGDTSQVIAKVASLTGDTSQVVSKVLITTGDTSQIVAKVLVLASDTSQVIAKVLVLASDTSQIVYKVVGVAGDTSQLIYNVNSLSAVSKNSQVVYKVAAPAGDTSQVVSKVATPTGDTSQVVAKVLVPTGDTSQVVAKVLVLTGDTSQVVAKVVGLGSDTSQVIAKVSAPAGDTSQIISKVRAPAGDTSQVIAKVSAPAGDTSQIISKVRSPAGDTSQVIAKVIGLGSDTSQIISKVRAPAGDTSQVIAKVAALAGDTSQVIAKVAVLAGDTSQVVSKVAGLTGDTSQIIYKVAVNTNAHNESFTGTPGDDITTSNTTLDLVSGAGTAQFQSGPGSRSGTSARLGGGDKRGYITTDASIPITSGKLFLRTYAYFDSIEGAYRRIFGAEDQQAAYLINGWQTWDTGGELRLSSLGGNSGVSFTFSLNTWYRLEVDIDYDAKTVVGRIYLGDSTTPVSTQNASWTTIARTNVNGQCDAIVIRRELATGYTYFDDFAWQAGGTSNPGPTTEMGSLSAVGKSSSLVYKVVGLASDTSQVIAKVAGLVSDTSQVIYKVVIYSVVHNEPFTGTPGDDITISNTMLDEVSGSGTAQFQINPGNRNGTGARFGGGDKRGYITTDASIPITSGKLFLRTYVYFDSIEGTYRTVFAAEDQQGAYLRNGWVTGSTGGELRLAYLGGTSGVDYTYSPNVWYRLEVDIDYDAKTVVGRIYAGDSVTPLTTQNVSWTTVARTNVNGQADAIVLRRELVTGYTYFDDFAWSREAQPGPTAEMTSSPGVVGKSAQVIWKVVSPLTSVSDAVTLRWNTRQLTNGIGGTARYFGVNTHPIWGSSTAHAVEAAYWDTASIPTVRSDCAWNLIEETEGVKSGTYFDQMEDYLVKADAHGVKVTLIITGAPTWAADTTGGGSTPPNAAHYSSYAAFCAWVTNRWGPHGSVSQSVEAIEVWNEPNFSGSWAGNGDGGCLGDRLGTRTPRKYSDLLAAAYDAIKAADASMIVVGSGGLLSQWEDWRCSTHFTNLTTYGSWAKMDVISCHNYPNHITQIHPELTSPNQPWYNPADKNASTIGMIETDILSVMTAAGYGSMPIWVTETGYSTYGTGGNSCTEAQQATKIGELLDDFAAQPWPTNFERIYWYSMFDGKASQDTDSEYNWGLINLNNEDYWNLSSVTPKPSWSTFIPAIKSLTAISEIDLRYRARTRTGNQEQIVYKARSLTTDSFQVIFKVFALSTTVGDTSQLVWRVSTTLGATDEVVYNVASILSDQEVIRYNVRRSVLDNSQIVWKVRASAGDTSTVYFQTLGLGIPISMHDVWGISF